MERKRRKRRRGLGPAGAGLMLFISLSPGIIAAQDIHFSLIDADPLLFNPAYAGFMEGDGRFGAVYRNQWATVSAPFQTVTATAEVSLTRSSQRRNGLSLGLWVSEDRAGMLRYGTTGGAVVLSYYTAVDRTARNLVSAAVEAGCGQASFATERMEMSEGEESFDRTRAFYPTLGAGVAWFCQVSDAVYTKLGVSVRNINEPDISYTGLNDVRLKRRFNLYGRAEWRFRSDLGLLPVAGYQKQGRYSELVYGCDVKWYVNEEPGEYLALSGGLLGRHGDAAAVNLSAEWRSWTFALSYDANLSRLAAASHTIGAFEVGIIYKIEKHKGRRRSPLPCPIF